MRALYAGSLPAYDLREVFRQVTGDCLLVTLLGVVFAGFDRLQNRMIACPEGDLRINPYTMKSCGRRARYFFVWLAQPNDFRFQLPGKTRPFQTLLVEIRLKV
jgi:hypothetical protein